MRPTNPECKARILASVVPLFAEKGYDHVTMREIAAKAGITPGSLYYHYSGKQELYLAAVKEAFSDRAQNVVESLSIDAPADERLRMLVHRFCEQLSRDRVFTRLIHREIIDGDDSRLALVVDTVFRDVFNEVVLLCRELAPSFDPFLLTISIISLTVYHYQIAGMRKFLPGSKPSHDSPDVVASHIDRLLKEGIGCRQNAFYNETLQGELSL